MSKQQTSYIFYLPFGLIVLLSIFMHFIQLDKQSLHHDESMHVFYSWFIYKGDLEAFSNIHSPMMHGPFQFFLNSLVFHIFGDTNYTARLLPAIFGIILTILPILFRKDLGNHLTLVFSFTLTISPTLLYFSRFARNDIYVAVWSLVIIACFLGYNKTGKFKYLIVTSFILALFFVTKESAYIFSAFLLIYLFITIASNFFISINKKDLNQLFHENKHTIEYFLFLLIICLPIGGAGFILFQDQLNLTLGSKDWPNIGLPAVDSTTPALIITITLSLISLILIFLTRILLSLHLIDRSSIWLSTKKIILIVSLFFFIFLIFHTSFFTKFDGIKIAFWQSLGYWIAQHDVARGAQPWFYYIMLSLVYEYSAIIIGTLSSIYFIFRGNTQERFIASWALITFLFYSYAGEKMPWLLVEVILPFYLVSFFGLHRFFKYLSGLNIKNYTYIYYSSLLFILILFLSPIMSTIRLVYVNPGWPNELLVYVQSSPHITDIDDQISEIAKQSNKHNQLTIQIDSTDGFSWPWAWYFRNYDSVSYRDFTNNPFTNPNQAADIVLLSDRNKLKNNYFLNQHHKPEMYIHRWWNPETYKEFSLANITFVPEITNNGCKLLDYFINRRFDSSVGSIYANIYVRKSLSEPLDIAVLNHEKSSC